jgi:Cysteine-rich secretory protein family
MRTSAETRRGRLRWASLWIPVALAAGCWVGMPAVHAQDQSGGRTDALVDVINHARVHAGLLPLARSSQLDAAAQAHSVDMVQHDYLDHTGSDGSEPQDRADEAGYHVPPNSGWIVVEVISAISADPQGPVDWWLNNEQHEKVLMNPRWREIGAGYGQGGAYANYWTALFGCRPGVLPSVRLDGVTYTHTEECGEPRVAAPVPTPTAQATATIQTQPAATPTAAPNLTTGRQSLQPTPATRISAERRDNTVTVTWASIARPTSTDWFGIYRVGDPDAAYQDWAYVSCTKAPDQARASGSCSLPMPAGTGAYDIRLFTSNGYTRLARSEQVANNIAAGAQVGLHVSADVADRASVVNVQWQAIHGAASTDWIGLYRSGAADTAPITWLYVGCAQLPLDARPLGSCNMLLPATLEAGSYELRLFSANSYQRLASARLRVK